jgi:ketosteroid isomerase-like protein
VSFPKSEIREVYDRLVATRDRIDRQELPWDALAEFFTEDVVYIDQGWGRIEGLENVKKFFVESMAGLEGWSFPRTFTAVDGNQLISGWQNRLPGRRADGSYYEALGISVLIYAGNGRFSYDEDILNMVHVYELIQESGWQPGPGFNIPPQSPKR